MPTVKDKITGAVISRQPYNDKGARNAATIADANPNWEVTHEDIPSSDARQRSSYQSGGEVLKDTQTRAYIEKNKKGESEVTVYVDSPTKQVGGEGGGKRRMYKGTASSFSPTLSKKVAESRARAKMAFSPSDSVATGGPKNFKKILKKERRKK